MKHDPERGMGLLIVLSGGILLICGVMVIVL